MDLRPIVDRLMYTSFGQKLVSSIFGLALALLFHRVCKDNCTIYYAPYVSEVEGNVFKLEDTCYKYEPYMTKCMDEQQILNPYDVNTKPENKIQVVKSYISEY
jgi:hypothetical protein